ncbi:hypothetical protein BRADI_3g13389v3 [Brachypodium distachyon]|uniref:Secreted protein n=1 Tax=Brachypodium distachyon TaxID=15368 RepID=A0A2K2CWV1_BRADI|nr:hypothetical protein BRADI_3g13389v3 [Brachypodium distachyon]
MLLQIAFSFHALAVAVWTEPKLKKNEKDPRRKLCPRLLALFDPGRRRPHIYIQSFRQSLFQNQRMDCSCYMPCTRVCSSFVCLFACVIDRIDRPSKSKSKSKASGCMYGWIIKMAG